MTRIPKLLLFLVNITCLMFSFQVSCPQSKATTKLQSSYKDVQINDSVLIERIQKLKLKIVRVYGKHSGMSGTGFVILDRRGHDLIITNYHVAVPILAAKDSLFIKVNIPSNAGDFPARLVNADSNLDIAILRGIESYPGSWMLKHFAINVSDFETGDVREGQGVFFIGYPPGFEQTINATVTRFGHVAQAIENVTFLIDAFVAPGYSGSPVFSASSGKLLGVVSAANIGHLNLDSSQTHFILEVPFLANLARIISVNALFQLVPSLETTTK